MIPPDHSQHSVADLAASLASLSLPDRIRLIRRSLPGRVVFTTSFGLEDQVITAAIAASGADIAIVTLDTGRLFPETYALWAETEERFGLRVAGLNPERSPLEELVARQGINGFRRSIEARQDCCAVRKVEPLGRALTGAAAWITGLRADQSGDRSTTPLAAYEPSYRLVKVNPLADWSRPDLVAHAAEHRIPLSPLHDRGFLSIGCAPCTRAVQPGESERAGRWWWESERNKECGLHLPRVPRPMPARPAFETEMGS